MADLPPPDQDAAPAAPAEQRLLAAGADLLIVGIGASAGGLAAFEAFFSAMPANLVPNMAFVLVQHLAPNHKSILTALVQRYTHMRVFEVTDGMVVQPNCAYIIPPNYDMALLNGSLHLLEPAAPHGMRLPIDFFFRSLAQDRRERAICIVLSGTGSDGTLGARAVKGEGGMVMAQATETTEYDGMPRSAIATGLVDYVLAPADMPAQLMAYAAHAAGERPPPGAAPPARTEDTLKKICVVLRAQTGHDFSQYKENTLIRRIERRMALHQIAQADDYLQYLQQMPAEVEALFRDLLIGVTSFFRDPEVFAALEAQVIPPLFADRPASQPIRVWVCGCSTGEEAYSLAILFQERLEALKQPIKVQIFATDIDSRAIDQARSGIYPASIAADVTPERLARFFVASPDGSSYRIHKAIRDLLIFSAQDVIKDPPFSKLDLLSCRNMLIYLNVDLQRKLIPLFHYALNPNGALMLGTSETVGEFTTLFAPFDRKWKIYLRQGGASGSARLMLSDFVPLSSEDAASPQRRRGPRAPASLGSLRELTEQALLAHYEPVGVLINGRGEILHTIGRTGNYLEIAPGDASMNMLAMAREGMRRELSAALHRAVAQREPVYYRGLQLQAGGGDRALTVNLTVRPVAGRPDDPTTRDLFLVVFEQVEPAAPLAEAPPTANAADAPDRPGDGRVAALEQELRAKDEYLQTTLEEMQTSNEELRSTNEEMQSVNEELQSTNEELETSKEELQSVNEELATVNAELQQKVLDLSRANNDMNNLLAGTGVGTLFVDMRLRIARFTPTITKVINLIQPDVGRPVGDIVSNLAGYDRLVQDVQAVLDTLIPVEAEVQSRTGVWYLMRIMPYRTLEQMIEGAVLTFTEITQRKLVEAALSQLQKAAERLAKGFQAIPAALAISSAADGRISEVNEGFLARYGVMRDAVLGRTAAELGLALGPDDPTATLRLVREHGVYLYESTIQAADGQPQPTITAIGEVELDGQPHLLTLTLDRRA